MTGVRGYWTRINVYSVLIAMLLLACFTGCGGGGESAPKTVPVSGTLIFKGKPLPKATVSFFGPKAVVPGTAVTDDAGKFSLTAVPGENVITVMAGVSNEMSVMDPANMTAGAGGGSTTASVSEGKRLADIPKAYTIATTSPLNHTVSDAGDQDVQLEIK